MPQPPAPRGDLPSNAFLLDLAQTLGRIEGQNQLILQEQGQAALARQDQQSALETIRVDIVKANEKLSKVTDRVTAIEPDVTRMKAFRGQVALAVFFVTAVVTGAINMVWFALTHLGEIKSALREFLR